jgi:hypothetical protein
MRESASVYAASSGVLAEVSKSYRLENAEECSDSCCLLAAQSRFFIVLDSSPVFLAKKANAAPFAVASFGPGFARDVPLCHMFGLLEKISMIRKCSGGPCRKTPVAQ